MVFDKCNFVYCFRGLVGVKGSLVYHRDIACVHDYRNLYVQSLLYGDGRNDDGNAGKNNGDEYTDTIRRALRISDLGHHVRIFALGLYRRYCRIVLVHNECYFMHRFGVVVGIERYGIYSILAVSLARNGRAVYDSRDVPLYPYLYRRRRYLIRNRDGDGGGSLLYGPDD